MFYQLGCDRKINVSDRTSIAEVTTKRIRSLYPYPGYIFFPEMRIRQGCDQVELYELPERGVRRLLVGWGIAREMPAVEAVLSRGASDGSDR